MKVTMKGISKSFGPVRVLEGVDFSIAGGEIHALVGENGAGKSTLMKILSGAHTADSGSILIDGEAGHDPLDPRSGGARHRHHSPGAQHDSAALGDG